MISFQWPVKLRLSDWWEPHYEWWAPGQPWWNPIAEGSTFLEKLCYRVMWGLEWKRHLLRVDRQLRAQYPQMIPKRSFVRDRANSELLLEKLLASGWRPPDTADDDPEPDPFKHEPNLRPCPPIEAGPTEMENKSPPDLTPAATRLLAATADVVECGGGEIH